MLSCYMFELLSFSFCSIPLISVPVSHFIGLSRSLFYIVPRAGIAVVRYRYLGPMAPSI